MKANKRIYYNMPQHEAMTQKFSGLSSTKRST